MSDTDTAADPLASAGALLASGRVGEAEAAFRALALSTRAAEVMHGIGAARLAAGDPAGALPYLDAATALGGEPRFGFNRAAALVRLGRIEEAKAGLRALIAEAPHYLPAPRMLSDILVGGGDPEGAADARGGLLERAIGAGSAAVIREELAAIVAIGRPPSNWPTLANMLRIGGREAEANRLIDLRLSVRPDCLRARFIRTMNRLAVVYASDEEIELRRALYTRDLEDLAERVAGATPEQLAEAAPEVGMAKPFFLSYQGETTPSCSAPTAGSSPPSRRRPFRRRPGSRARRGRRSGWDLRPAISRCTRSPSCSGAGWSGSTGPASR